MAKRPRKSGPPSVTATSKAPRRQAKNLRKRMVRSVQPAKVPSNMVTVALGMARAPRAYFGPRQRATVAPPAMRKVTNRRRNKAARASRATNRR